MGLFNKKKKIVQDLTQEEKIGPFIIHLLMAEKCEMPEKQEMCDVMNAHLGKVDCFSYDEEHACFAPKAELLVDFIEALAELFPTCQAMIFENSKKMVTRQDILDCRLPKKMKFIYYAVNIRLFTIHGGQDMIIDTLGMSTLFLPDLQYHFHGMNPNHVVYHAKNVLSYIYENNNPIESGEHLDGLANGEMTENIQWYVQYENSIVQPARQVLDINMGEFAAGNR